jgi:hypothetical protein
MFEEFKQPAVPTTLNSNGYILFREPWFDLQLDARSTTHQNSSENSYVILLEYRSHKK